MLLQRIAKILGEMRGIDIGTTSTNDKELLLIHDEKDMYVLSLEYVGKPSEDMFKEIDKYLKR